MKRTYCGVYGVAMDGEAKDCRECFGKGPHRDVPDGICGSNAACDDKHGHHCELAPGHLGDHAAPEAKAACRKECEQHTPCPEGYVAWHAWAEKMSKTHRQRRCAGCGLFQIWEPLRKEKQR